MGLFSYLRESHKDYMRYSILRKHSTKAERRVYEVLKELKIPFKHRWIVQGREVDFIINNTAIEIDGHSQNRVKNQHLVKNGYRPIHIGNNETRDRAYIRRLILSLI